MFSFLMTRRTSAKVEASAETSLAGDVPEVSAVRSKQDVAGEGVVELSNWGGAMSLSCLVLSLLHKPPPLGYNRADPHTCMLLLKFYIKESHRRENLSR